MSTRLTRDLLRVWCVVLLSLMLAATAPIDAADAEEDFNSPTPILLSERGSTRALAIKVDDWSGVIPKRGDPQAFTPGARSRVVFFVTNLALMNGEGANALRIYLEDASGRRFRLNVEDLQPMAKDNSVYAVFVSLYDKTEYNGQPQPVGDHLVRLTWRGLTSNRVRLGIGKIGGDIKDAARAIPTSYPLSKKIIDQVDDGIMAEYAVGLRYQGDRTRFMQQATFGPTPALNDRIRRLGIRTWLAMQLEATGPSTPYPNLPLMNSFTSATASQGGCGGVGGTCIRDNYSMYLLQNWFYLDAFYGENQLQHRTAWALSQIWVTAYPEVQQPSHMLQYQKILDNGAFGDYRKLMHEMTLNPAMGQYLDMMGSTRNNPNENYARELMQLFTTGVFMLNQDGTVQTDGNGEPIPTYSQDTVNNFTEIFTGWQPCEQLPPICPSRVGNGVPNFKDPMLLVQSLHNTTSKTLLSYPGAQNVNIPADQDGMTDLSQALDNIFYHPNVGPFVSKLMIQHLVTSDPTPAYVSRVAAVFNNDGQANRGNMKAVVRAVLLDPEARGDVKTDPTYGKLREPVQLLTNMARQIGVCGAPCIDLSDGVVNPQASLMAQNVYQAPSVFNYYPADYIVPGTTLNGPEFGILNTGTAILRANFINTIVYNTIPITGVAPKGTSLDFSALQSLAAADPTCNLLIDELNNKMLHGKMSPQMRNSILTATTAVPSSDTLGRVKQAVFLVGSSSQFQVQR